MAPAFVYHFRSYFSPTHFGEITVTDRSCELICYSQTKVQFDTEKFKGR